MFHQWPGRLAATGIEVWTAQLPGRENRIHETPLDHLPSLVNQLAGHFPAGHEPPFLFFGHSMGGLLAYELARALRQNRRTAPILLIIAAAAAPHAPLPEPHLNNLPRPALLAALETRYGGIPPAIVDHAELLDLLMPPLRADMRLCETYVYRPEPPLSCTIITLGGLEDSAITRRDLTGWQQHTTQQFELHLLPGGHFFVQQEVDTLLPLLSKRIALHTARDAPN
jgi:medium-chain acyl-[acyl-carrier-protein] hydrolase